VLRNDLVLDMLIPPVAPHPRLRPAFDFPNMERYRLFREQELELEAGERSPLVASRLAVVTSDQTRYQLSSMLQLSKGWMSS
jgi:hypothetical protein